MAWLAENYLTLIICLALLGAVAGIVIKLTRDKKKGRTNCGCGCENCPMSGACHNKMP